MTDTVTQSRPRTEPPHALSATFGYYAGFIGLGLSMAVLGPTLPGLAEMTGTALAGISYLFTAKSAGYMVGTLLAGPMYDKHRGHLILAGALALMAAGLALVPTASMILILAALIFIIGLGEGFVDVGANALLVWAHPTNLDPFMNALHFFFGVGAFFAPVIIAQTMQIGHGISAAYWMIAIVLLLPAAWIIRLPSPATGRSDDAGERPDGRPVFVLLIAAFFFTFVACELSFGGWIYTYAERSGLGSLESAAYLTSAFWAALTAGRLIGIPLSTRLSASRILLFDLVGALISISIILAFPASAPALWIGTIGMGASIATMFATGLNYAEKRMVMTGKITSIFLIGGSLGSMTVPWLIGQLFERMGPGVTMQIVAVDMVVSALLFAVIARYCRKHNLSP